ncbi:MAG: diphthine synthase [Candidatus Micrarchaeota archaeon]|nr:diphthine synthase [Candidatus Micrarchaeota archaeon]
MSLTLIGTGISFDLTLSAIDELKQCDEIYIEQYTNLIEEEKITTLEQKINKKIIRIERKDVESSFLVNKAKTAKIALLASGDPLTATTHVSLVIDAKTAKIAVKIIPNSSIFTVAAGKAGLQIYRFGKTASLVNPRPNYTPTSALDLIRENQQRNAHSLVLLDTEPKPMEAKVALEMLKALLQATSSQSTSSLKLDAMVVLSRLGEKDEKISYGTIEKLLASNLGKPPFSIIIPAKLHMVEEEYLELLKV